MIKTVPFKNAKIRYKIQGEGFPLLLLHGYLESLDVWGDFSEKLSLSYKVIAIDFPGHGKSETIGKIHTMELMAEAVNAVLENELISKCVLIGHSMGGYVVLSFLKQYADKLLGFSLFHSHPFEDTEQVRSRRIDEIDLIETGKKELIIKANIPKAFANENVENFRNDLELVKEIARNTDEQGMINVLKGMKDRPDSKELLKECDIPFLFILGKKDNYIVYDAIKNKIQIPLNSELYLLKKSGHMGFIEEREKSLDIVNEFITKILKRQ